MPAPSPKSRSVSSIKSTLLRPSLTSHFQCFFNPPKPLRPSLINLEDRVDNENTRTFIDQKVAAGISGIYDADKFSILCSEASLPGSSLATHELNNDFTGVTERHAYRRLYDDRADFTFYVDDQYDIITFFETWMSYVVNEQYTDPEGTPNGGLEQSYYNYRVNYPNVYRTEIYLHKFERDYKNRFLQYRFLQAYPINISSMPVSYDSSTLLKCTVSFTYTRYVINKVGYPSPSVDTNNSTKSAAAQASGNTIGFYGPAFGNLSNEEILRESGVIPGEGDEIIGAQTRRLTNYAGQPLF